MKKNSRRKFLKTATLIFAGLLSGSLNNIKAFKTRDEELKNVVTKIFKLSIDEKVTSLRLLEKEFGKEKIKEIVEILLREQVVNDWKGLASSAGKNDLKTYIDILWNKYCKKDGLKWTESQEGNKTVMHCTYCPHYEKWKKLDATDWGFELMCKTDYYMIEGFNPDIKFERTKTLMQGDEYCNHTYIVKSE